jgi:hypothetical protein
MSLRNRRQTSVCSLLNRDNEKLLFAYGTLIVCYLFLVPIRVYERRLDTFTYLWSRTFLIGLASCCCLWLSVISSPRPFFVLLSRQFDPRIIIYASQPQIFFTLFMDLSWFMIPLHCWLLREAVLFSLTFRLKCSLWAPFSYLID